MLVNYEDIRSQLNVVNYFDKGKEQPFHLK
jgi:hypothetical protein